jgi:hypothetical protein
MPFSNSDSLTATNLNNMLRGLYRDNTTRTVTGTTDETQMAALSVTGGTITETGGLLIFAAGTITNSAGGAKTVRLKLGATTVGTVSRTGANAQDWFFLAQVSNTANNAQRWSVLFSTTDATTTSFDYTTSAIDTASNATLEVTGQLANGSDSITQTMFNVFVSQIT